MLVAYRRSGGPDPQSDESVDVSAQGAVTSRRVVSIGRAGRFASELDAAELKSLAKAVAAAADAEVELAAPGRPPYEIEAVEASSTALSFHPEQKLPRPVTTLRNRLRKLYEDLGDNPVAGIELAVDASGTTATLRAIGVEPCDVDWTNASATFDLYDARQAWQNSGAVDFRLEPGRQQAAVGWRTTSPLPGVDFSPEKTLQLRFMFSMKFDDERWRECQITVVAGKGW